MKSREIDQINTQLKKNLESANHSFAGAQVVLMSINRILKTKISLASSSNYNVKDPNVGKAITAQYKLTQDLQFQLSELNKNEIQKIASYLSQLSRYTGELRLLMNQSVPLSQTIEEQKRVANLHKTHASSKVDVSGLLNVPLGENNRNLKAEITRSTLAELQAAEAALKKMKVPNRGSWEKKSSIVTRREEIHEEIKNRLAKEANKKVPLKATPVKPTLLEKPKPPIPPRPTYLQQAGHFGQRNQNAAVNNIKKPAGRHQPPNKPLPPIPPSKFRK